MDTTTQSKPLTAEQIANWRKVLALMFGPIAEIMPEAEIIAFRDQMQQQLGRKV